MLSCSAGMAVMNAFAAMLGLHAGMTYANSRTAIATSIGTLLFLFLGIATCMRIMLAFSNSFDYSVRHVLSASSPAAAWRCTWRSAGETRSDAIAWASVLTPFATFYRDYELPARATTAPCFWSPRSRTASRPGRCWCRRSTCSTSPRRAASAREE